MPGPNSPYTNLDAAQVITQAFNESEDRIRVDAEITAVIGVVEVAISASEDSIQSWTRDGVGNPITSTGGKLDVNAGIDFNNATIAAVQSGNWSVGRTWTLASSADSVNVGNFPPTQIISGTVSTVTPSYIFSTVSTVTSVSASASNVTLLASNSARKGAIFYNDSTSICYVKFGTTATSSDFTIAMDSKSTIIIDSNPIYTGRVDGIWVSATGAMKVTELT